MTHTRAHIIIIFTLVGAFISGCNMTRRLDQDEKLLTSNNIEIEGKGLNDGELNGLVRPRTNKKIVGLIPFNLFVWNLFDGEKLKKKNARKHEKLKRKNEKRAEKGKKEKEFKPVLGYRIKNNIGEEPVLLDSSTAETTAKNMTRYLKNNGFFNGEVTYKVKSKEKKQRAEVTYLVTLNRPYLIKKVSYDIQDTGLIQDVRKAVQGTLLKRGENFRITDVDKERSRLTKAMRDLGYYDFNQNFITYEVDSTLGNKDVHVKQIINSPVKRVKRPNQKDTLIVQQHTKYTIKNVYIDPYYSTEFETDFDDTLMMPEGCIMVNQKRLLFEPKVISRAIFINPGEKYSQAGREYTYSRLSALNNFRFINIRFEEVSNDSAGLNCYINLTPVVKLAAGAELEGTNTGGNLGISGNLNYTNRNTFGAAEIFNVRLRGGLEAQQTNVPEAEQDERSTLGVNLFNTIEYGLETSLTVPSLVVPARFKGDKVPKYNRPTTSVNLTFNHQNRPDFTRNFLNASYSYAWTKAGKVKTDFTLHPLSISLIGIDKRPFFERRLEELNNQFLTNTFSNHLIVGTKFNVTQSNQGSKRRINHYWNRSYIETAGNALSAAYNLSGADKIDDHYYQTGSIRFAQFIKVANDLRFYRNLTDGTQMVYRLYTGAGVPFGNLNVLPFDKSFFVGGANDIRAWTARTLGPGSSVPETGSGLNRVGDIILEANVEYRAKLTNIFELALFTDVGNIWLFDGPDVDPSSVFELDRFYNEFAVGAGLGVRFDFTFVIVRVDLGFQIRDPALPKNERWIFQKKDLYNETAAQDYSLRQTLNFGIGYPF